MTADHSETGRAAIHFVNLCDMLDFTDAFAPLAKVPVFIRKWILFPSAWAGGCSPSNSTLLLVCVSAGSISLVKSSGMRASVFA